jgi:hypothetical protein
MLSAFGSYLPYLHLKVVIERKPESLSERKPLVPYTSLLSSGLNGTMQLLMYTQMTSQYLFLLHVLLSSVANIAISTTAGGLRKSRVWVVFHSCLS